MEPAGRKPWRQGARRGTTPLRSDQRWGGRRGLAAGALALAVGLAATGWLRQLDRGDLAIASAATRGQAAGLTADVLPAPPASTTVGVVPSTTPAPATVAPPTTRRPVTTLAPARPAAVTTAPPVTAAVAVTTTTVAAVTTVAPPPPTTALAAPATTTSVPTTTSTAPSTSGATSTTVVACRNSADPACGPFRFDPQPGADTPMTVQVVVEPAAPQAGQAVLFRLTLTDPDGVSHGSSLFGFGDSGIGDSRLDPCAKFGPWAPPARDSAHAVETQDVAHTYFMAGTYTATFAFDAGPFACTDDVSGRGDRPYASSGSASITVVVA